MKVFLRIVTALSTAALVVGALLALDRFASRSTAFQVVLPIVIVLSTLAHLELCLLLRRRYDLDVAVAVGAGLCFLAGFFYLDCNYFVPIVFVMAMTALFSGRRKPVEEFAVTLMSFLYVPWFFSFLIRIPAMHGVMTLLYVIAIVKFSDMGGFAFGMLLGRHKLCPTISPNKTWEGLLGSIIASVLMSLAFVWMGVVGYSPWQAAAFGVAAALFGTLGDLFESRIKRECGAKDSATFMPAGLGGFLDMVDSLLFVPALLCPFL